jgi:hypothetical protein
VALPDRDDAESDGQDEVDDAADGPQAVAYLVFALIGTIGVGAPVVICLACLIIGAKLVGDAVGALTG